MLNVPTNQFLLANYGNNFYWETNMDDNHAEVLQNTQEHKYLKDW